MSKTITIPDIGYNPINLRINCTDYVFHAGETATVPDDVAALLAGIVESFPKPAEDGYRTKPATIGDVEDMIAAGGGTGLPEVTTDDNGKFLGVQEGEWAKADAPSGGTYDVDFEVTESGGVYSATTDANLNDALDAIEAGKIVLGVASLTEGYMTFFRVVSCSEDSIVFGAITYNQTPVYTRVVWSGTGVVIEIYPLTVAGS